MVDALVELTDAGRAGEPLRDRSRRRLLEPLGRHLVEPEQRRVPLQAVDDRELDGALGSVLDRELVDVVRVEHSRRPRRQLDRTAAVHALLHVAEPDGVHGVDVARVAEEQPRRRHHDVGVAEDVEVSHGTVGDDALATLEVATEHPQQRQTPKRGDVGGHHSCLRVAAPARAPVTGPVPLPGGPPPGDYRRVTRRRPWTNPRIRPHARLLRQVRSR